MSLNKVWVEAAKTEDIPENGGACVLLGGKQIAIFHLKSKDQWYACDNLCKHKMQNVLSRGILGDHNGEPKIACPLHKKSYSLLTGKNLNGEDYAIEIYPVKAENGSVYVELDEV